MLTQLQTLQLYDNNLSRLPDGVCQLTQLRHLSCGVNRLVAVPEQVGRLVNLRELCRGGVLRRAGGGAALCAERTAIQL